MNIKVLSIMKQVGILGFLIAGVKELYRKIWREFIHNSYAQDWEDREIEKIIGKKHGFYLDIGAYHPSRLSNTFRLYQKGWNGTIVEPNPDAKILFNKVRPRDHFINTGVGIKNGSLKYYKYPIPALNTFSEEQVLINKKKGFYYGEILNIKIINIQEFLKQNIDKKIDVLSLDIEGWDAEILKHWDWKYKPQLICVETNGNSRTVENILTPCGYRTIFENKVNTIYCLPSNL